MTGARNYLAFDLGAESGRAMLGTLDAERLALREMHRFPNCGVAVGDRIHWDALRLFSEMKEGLRLAGELANGGLAAMGIDTWGVDFALLDGAGRLVANPVHYRDPRTNGIFDRAFEIVSKERIFERTGLQFLQFNTLLQLVAMRLDGDPALDRAASLLMMPDLFNYWFTGVAATEYSIASTTQCMDPRTRDWARDLLREFDIPPGLFGEIRQPGMILGPVRGEIRAELGLGELPVALPAEHDTASAVLAAPARPGTDWAYISCGTWSLIGAEITEPVITPAVLAANFTNEGGAFGTTRLLSNCMGLWLLQGARKAWLRRAGSADAPDLTYEAIIAAAEAHRETVPLLDPDDPLFFNPADMLESVAEFCRRTGQPPPESVGATARSILVSLALKYRFKIEQLESLLGRTVTVIHVLGGGSRNSLLCRLTADVTGREVIAGPAEATAIGNLLMQGVADGRIGGLNELRSIVRGSGGVETYNSSAQDSGVRPEDYEQFLSIMARG